MLAIFSQIGSVLNKRNSLTGHSVLLTYPRKLGDRHEGKEEGPALAANIDIEDIWVRINWKNILSSGLEFCVSLMKEYIKKRILINQD
jgi:hypothetical protein